MKCIRCGANNNLSDRAKFQGYCKNCGHPFFFESTAIDKNIQLTDELFMNIENIRHSFLCDFVSLWFVSFITH